MYKEYLKYLINRKGAHALHSPFLFDFYQKVIQPDYTLPDQHKKYLNSLKTSNASFNIEDFGAGSKIFKEGEERPVKRIHQYSSISSKKGKLLAKIIAHYELKNILELGTCLGAGTVYMQSGLRESGEITTIEGDSELHKFTKNQLNNNQIININPIHAQFDNILPTLQKEGDKFDLIFVDGNHQGKATLRYINQLIPLMNDQTFLILDDIYWSQSMIEMWKNVINNKHFHITIDLFKMGILIPRKEQVKQHFILKF